MSRMLTFELDNNDEIEIHANKEGLRYLIDQLNNMYLSNKNDHYHLMTPSWAGNELTEEKQNEASTLINHVRIVFWE